MKLQNSDAIVYFGEKLADCLMSPYSNDPHANTAGEFIFLLYLFTGEGHVCLNASNPELPALVKELYNNFEIDKPLPKFAEFKNLSARFPDVFGVGGEFKPVICGNNHTYYFHKHYTHETRLSASIRELLEEDIPSTDEQTAVPEDILKTLALSDERKRAVTNTLRSKFTVITGGPGTGKTTAIINILRLLANAANRKPRVYLCAPTGKAAMRLREAVINGKKEMASKVDAITLSYIPEDAHTIHSVIRYGFSGDDPIKKPRQPIVADCVIVDESSMMDLFLATALFSAFTPDTRFVLLGDANQLSSVEAGSVFQDICDTLQNHDQYRRSLFVFNENFRFSKHSLLSNLSQTVLNGDPAAFFKQLEDGAPNLNYATLGAHELNAFLDRSAAEILKRLKNLTPDNYCEYAREEVILTALRRGLYGCEYINRQIENRIRQVLRLGKQNEWYHGRKIMVLLNRGGFNNGDVAVCLKNSSGELRLYFDKDTQKPSYPLYVVNAYEPAFSLTVHKSQGSEYNTVNVVFPNEGSRLLSRELLYTAVTRSRGVLNLFGDRAVIEQSISQVAFRETGLRKKLADDISKEFI